MPIFEPFVFNLLEATNKHLFIWTEEIRLKEDIVVDSSIMQRGGERLLLLPQRNKMRE